jgi:hypothetical protein
MHYHHPDKSRARVVIFYRDFKDYPCDSDDYGYDEYGYKRHRGLYINALMTARVLRKLGIVCDLAAVNDVSDVRTVLAKRTDVTHAIFQAIWIDVGPMCDLLATFPGTHFIVRTHSQIGFLQVEPRAIAILRGLLVTEQQMLNLTVSANTTKLQHFLEGTYKTPVVYLPNLYDVDRVARKRDESHRHRLLRIGSFGAHRLLKNHTTAAAAALLIAQRHGSDLEFYVNGGREENVEKGTILRALEAMFADVPWAKLVVVPWAEWAQFRATIAFMDLCMQTSFTETFNIVTADAASEGVPSVVSDAIEWTPRSWHANVDDAEDIARVGAHLLWDHHAAQEGLRALEDFEKRARAIWLDYLDSNPTV